MNRHELGKLPMIELLNNINMNIEECLYQILSRCTDDMKRSRCEKMKCCYDCLSEWLNEGGRKMYIKNKWYEPCEVNAMVSKLEDEKRIAEEELAKAKALLMQIRAFYGETMSWGMYEEDVLELIGEEHRNENSHRWEL